MFYINYLSSLRVFVIYGFSDATKVIFFNFRSENGSGLVMIPKTVCLKLLGAHNLYFNILNK